MSKSNHPTVYCSSCNEPQPSGQTFRKCSGCRTVQYCNTTCQKKHWKEHRTECERLRKEKEEDTTNNNLPPTYEEGDECPICLEILPKDVTKFLFFTCCGNGIHVHCFKDMESMKMSGTCPFCRAKTPTSQEEAIKYLRPWVKKKKAWALANMGRMYYHGKGVKQSYEMARILFEQTAQQGDASAMFDLGVMYAQGLGVEQSYERAVEYYEQAAQQGDASAMYELGVMYEGGEGVEQSYERAIEYYKRAAEQGHVNAMANLGHLYIQGDGVDQSDELAREWWTKAANVGHETSINNLKILDKEEAKSGGRTTKRRRTKRRRRKRKTKRKRRKKTKKYIRLRNKRTRRRKRKN